MLDLFIHWSVSPEVFSVGGFTVRWYGILYACAFIVSSWAFKELMQTDMSAERVNQILVYMILGTIIGARIGDCFFYHPLYYLQHPLEIVAVWKGGLSSHGGACGILIALYLFSRKIKKPYIWVLDRVVIVIGVAGFFIRMGNLANSEIYGIETALPWGFIFERNHETLPKHPTQIYEALYYALTYAILRFVYRRYRNRPKPFFMFGLFLLMVFVFRFCIEFIKNPQEDFEESMLFNMGQWLSVPFILAGIASLIISRRQKTAPLIVKPTDTPLRNVSSVHHGGNVPPPPPNGIKPKKKKSHKSVDMHMFIPVFLLTAVLHTTHAQERIDLSGEWRFAADREETGQQQAWFGKDLNGTVHLPGSMPENLKISFFLTPDKHYIG
ncbi:MAG: prolipoprotein diacylglyceryl transferase [Bacteroidales bacterium]|jgi:prolipoprotein diacylglyceryl transferase|nr:prolipoprotein diacylglyceryl transferase [Bacteroidales bacterium]